MSNDRFYVEIDIPDLVQILELHREDLPDNWDTKPALVSTQIIGDTFVREGSAAVLKVPSAIVPTEYNYLINPLHPDVEKISISTIENLTFDTRLRKNYSFR